MSLKADLLRAHLNLHVAESKQINEEVKQMMQLMIEEFDSLEPEVRTVVLDALDEMAQECVRKREIFETALTTMKNMQEDSHGE